MAKETFQVGDVLEVVDLSGLSVSCRNTSGETLKVGDRITVAAISGAITSFIHWEVGDNKYHGGIFSQRFKKVSSGSLPQETSVGNNKECRCVSLLFGHSSDCFYFNNS